MLEVKVLPARFGDSIWIEYGHEHERHYLLIDGGTGGTRHDIRRELLDLSLDRPSVELAVVSHIDRDHIEGILSLLDEDDPGFEIRDVWFNGWPHLPDNPEDERFGAVQGERLTQRILDLGIPWNKAFDGKAVVVPENGPLPEKTLLGGLRLTLLSPTSKALADLKPEWSRDVRDANLDPGFALEANDDLEPEEEVFGGEELPDIEALAASDFDDDSTKANGSSIALLAEYENKCVLLAADAHAGTLTAALERLSPGEQIHVDLFKISHHGSMNATSRALIEKVDCPAYVFSTNGSVYGHPHPEAVSRVIVAGRERPELIFNYRSSRNSVWDLAMLKQQHNYSATYPEDDPGGIMIAL